MDILSVETAKKILEARATNAINWDRVKVLVEAHLSNRLRDLLATGFHDATCKTVKVPIWLREIEYPNANEIAEVERQFREAGWQKVTLEADRADGRTHVLMLSFP